jgi:potassium-dependent mechanosensitive channel
MRGGGLPGRSQNFFLVVAGLLLLTAHGSPGAQIPSVKSMAGSAAINSGGTESSSVADQVGGLSEVPGKLAAARAALGELGDEEDLKATGDSGISSHDVRIRRTLLQTLILAYEQRGLYQAEREDAGKSREEDSRLAKSWLRFAEPAPYGIMLGERLREEFQVEKTRSAAARDILAIIAQVAEQTHAILQRSEEEIRLLNEKLEGYVDKTDQTRLAWQRTQEGLRSELAVAVLANLDLDRATQQEILAASGIRQELLQRQIAVADADTVFTQAELEQIIARTTGQGTRLRRELPDLDKERAMLREDLARARDTLRTIKERQGANDDETAQSAERVDLLVIQLATVDTRRKLSLLQQEGLNLELTLWEIRFAIQNDPDYTTLRSVRKRLVMIGNRLRLVQNRSRLLIDEAAAQLNLGRESLAALDEDATLWPLYTARLAALKERNRILLDFQGAVGRLANMVVRWGDSLQAAERRLPLLSRATILLADARPLWKNIWNFELFTVEDSIVVDGRKVAGQRNVTIGKIVNALAIILIGLMLTGLVSKLLVPVITRRLKIEPAQAMLIRRWTRTAMIACLVVISLLMVKIPLTVFAFAGGALAIGIGFGLQTLIKNFISGLILLFERPFRVGDVLEIDGQRCAVNEIGLRSSVMKLQDGKEILIPNSSLLENNLTNLTYSDRSARVTVAVGVAYGSDLRQVVGVLEKVTRRHGLVNKEPGVSILLTDFGGSALNFEIRFWVDVSKADRSQVASDMRLMIASAFDECGIVIAYPQQDIHLDIVRPLPVEIISAGGDSPPMRVPE